MVAKHEVEYFVIEPDSSGPTLCDFLGNEKNREELKQVIKSMAFSKLFRAYGIQPDLGVLLNGPPGTGKSWFIECLQGELLDIGKMYARLDYNIGNQGSPYINENSTNMQSLFDFGNCVLDDGYDGIIYWFDEAEIILGSRGESRQSKEDRKTLETLMKNMQNIHLKKTNEFMFFATNYKSLMDKAALRSGRIDRTVEFELPDEEARRQLYLNRMKMIRQKVGYNVFPNVNGLSLARESEGVSCSDCYAFVDAALKQKLYALANNAPGIIAPPTVTQNSVVEQIMEYKKSNKTKRVGFKSDE